MPDRQKGRQPDLAQILPVRPGRVGLAVLDLLADPADAVITGGSRCQRSLSRTAR